MRAYLIIVIVVIVVTVVIVIVIVVMTTASGPCSGRPAYVFGWPPEYGRSCDYSEQVTIIAYYSLLQLYHSL